MAERLEVTLACITEETLAAFAEGHFDEEAWRPIEDHVADCGDCRAVLARAAGVGNSRVEASRGVPDNEVEAEELAPGTRVGRYVVHSLIGRGAMGVVYAADDPDLDRKVALKLLRSDGLSDAVRQRMRARLLREAQAMARLSHPEVIMVHDVGAFGDQLFVAMEYVEGETLRQWRAARHRGYREVLAVYERAGSGLAAAHEAGLVHRDFKPDNVLVGRDGRVRVTDFGLARSAVRVEDTERSDDRNVKNSEVRSLAMTRTRTGSLLGTPAYMAPEQLCGNPADARSDVFGFCVAFYEALYSERPFAGSTVHVLKASIESGAVRAAPVMTRVPPWVRAVLLRGLCATPTKRFASMRELLDALRAGHAAWRRRMTGAVAMAVVGAVAGATLYARSTTGVALHGPSTQATAPAAHETTAATPSRGAAGPIAETPSPSPSPDVAPAAPAPARPAPSLRAHAAPTLPPHARPPTPAASATPVGNNGALILE